MAMKVDGDWGCGENCGEMIEFFKDEKKHTCHKCGQKVHNEMVGQDCC